MIVEKAELLNGRQIRNLRARGHGLKPVVSAGKAGITDSLLAAVDQQLEAHELIKVRCLDACPLRARQAAEVLAERTAAAVVQILGKTILLYREGEESRILSPFTPGVRSPAEGTRTGGS